MIDYKNYDEDNHNYSPNDLAELSRKNPEKYRRIVKQNIPEDISVEQWEEDNLRRAQMYLRNQSH
jgi:hypothetical protein